ncbi:GroES-like protein [Aspergillus steynii IBT 23096]|uniref:GroES-like protein n=1 Tax=Aspergillus steynii IBT 23096 TaxID=1392250 RepID=A0A2I2G7H4_9EURO|nr:GroES-like protein [Aspergillus steynii IBT 23096]PLB48803.1 GroES-like protein [Aspergillus steynii IBT 23096]
MVQAVVVSAPAVLSIENDRPMPTLRDNSLLVKVVSVGLNPTDWKNGLRSQPGVTVGCDYAGIIEAIGPAVQKPFRVGDRVFGSVHGCNPEQPSDGAFAEHIIARADLATVIPENLTFQQAATLGVSLVTIGQSLYQTLRLPPPPPTIHPEPTPSASAPAQYILIYGGSTSVGTLAIQFAKLSGYTVLTTCSPQHESLLRTRGADHIYSYHDTSTPQRIRSATADQLTLVLDTISTPETASFCGNAMSSHGGDYTALLPGSPVPREDVRSRWTLAYTAGGYEFLFHGKRMPACPEDRDFTVEWLATATRFLAEGVIVPHPVRVGDGGLNGVVNGLHALREGMVRGCPWGVLFGLASCWGVWLSDRRVGIWGVLPTQRWVNGMLQILMMGGV